MHSFIILIIRQTGLWNQFLAHLFLWQLCWHLFSTTIHYHHALLFSLKTSSSIITVTNYCFVYFLIIPWNLILLKSKSTYIILSAYGIPVIIRGNELCDQGSNPGWSCLHFISCQCSQERHEPISSSPSNSMPFSLEQKLNSTAQFDGTVEYANCISAEG